MSLALLGFELLRPRSAWALALALVVFAAGIWGARRRRVELARLGLPARLARLVPARAPARGALRLGLAVAGAAALALAWIGPVRGTTWRESVTRGIDLVVCLDTSRSMLAEDLRPTRLARAEREIRGLLDAMRSDRVAIVAFAGDAREVAPLTHDRETLKGLLDFVEPADNRVGGTDLAAALDEALSLFDGRTGAHEAIVLVTDGEDLEGKGLEKAREATQRGIRVYVVGVGTAAGGKIPVRLRDGSQGFLRGPDGEEVVTKLDGTTLARLAEETGGAYLSTEDSPAPLETLYRARMSQLEGRESEGGRRRIPHDRFQWPLFVGVLCLMGELSLRERSGLRRRRDA